MGMLRDFLEKDLVSFETGGISWQDAIRVSANNFLKQGIVEESYVQEVIECVNEYGPYIVILPGVAMPHSSQSCDGVKGTAISFTKFDTPIVFDEEDESKTASIFFTLAARNEEEHLNNMSMLSDTLMDEDILNALLEVKDKKGFEELVQKYESDSE